MLAPVCGCSIMSLRSVVLNRPLRARSSPTSCATSKDAAAASGDENGTIAMGMASACPFVISTTSSARARAQNTSKPVATKHEKRLFIGLEPKYKVSFKKRRIRRIRQRGCTIHRILDRLAGGRVAVALGDARTRHLAARNLGDFDQAIQSHGRGWRLDPRSLDPIAQSRDIAVTQRAGLDGGAVFLVGQLFAQFGLALLAGALLRRVLGLGDLLGLGRPLGFRGSLGV